MITLNSKKDMKFSNIFKNIKEKISQIIKKNKKQNSQITFINMPIDSQEDDKIGIYNFAKELENVIDKGAQTIAITSNFGGGKSSLVKYLESFYSKFTTKFCYVNLWCDIESKASPVQIHKSFIYQLASQISRNKGRYVSKRLSENYGLFRISLPNAFLSFLSYLMFAFVIIGVLSTTFFEDVSQFVSFDFFNTYHDKIGTLSFIIAIFLGLIFIYKADIVFSAKKSGCDRKIDEHELMDIYKSYICNFHFKHYIVIIEDLDRSNSTGVKTFIKELRRYYVPYSKKNTRFKCINNINRITFIVNIKEESELPQSCNTIELENIYPKAFDYIVSLREINIDNYDVILKKLLMENKSSIEEQDIKIFTDEDTLSPEFEWIIRGKNISIREIKNRLSTAISTYISLREKFKDNKNDISLAKCMVAAYLTSEFAEDYKKIKDVGFDKAINIYICRSQITSDLILDTYQNLNLSKNFASELSRIISSKLIDYDYKQYYFNYPADSYLHNSNENGLINVILYDEDISAFDDFESFVNNVVEANKSVVTTSLKRLQNLDMYCPKCIFYSNTLLNIAFEFDEEMVWNTFEISLSYEEESLNATLKILTDIISNNFIKIPKRIEKLCEIVIAKTNPATLVKFRKSFINDFLDEFVLFKSLYADDLPLITIPEVKQLKKHPEFLILVNYNSSELSMELVKEIHIVILSEFDIEDSNSKKLAINHYHKSYEIFGESENELLTKFMFEFMIHFNDIYWQLEKLIIENNDIEDIEEKYIFLINKISEYKELEDDTLEHIDSLNIVNGLSEKTCKQLYEHEYYKSFVINAISTNPDIIDFYDDNVINTINGIDYFDNEDNKVSLDLLLNLRTEILKISTEIVSNKYLSLFKKPNPIINNSELLIIANKEFALKLIDESQISEDNYEYISDYLSESLCDQKLSYSILLFVSLLDDNEIKKDVFDSLNFNNIQFYRIAKAKRNEIVKNMSDAFDFKDIDDMIAFMTKTMCSNDEFEKIIKEQIKNKEFKDNDEKSYIEYVKVLKRIPVETINNITSINTIYCLPYNVLEKLLDAKKYTYYIVSKSLLENRFTYEKDKIDIFWPSYKKIILSEEGCYTQTKNLICRNEEFISYCAEKELYKGTQEYNRLFFAYCQQTEELLSDLFDNYDDVFCIKYLSVNKGFKNKESATLFVNKMKQRKKIAASNNVYNNNYDPLVDFILKGKFTKIHNKAK